MLSDPAAAAWVAAGRPAVDAPAPVDGRCGRCGEDGPTVTSARIISEKFTGFDAWPFGSRRLCVPCAWAYARQPTTQPALLITATTVKEYSGGAALADVLTDGPLSSTQAVVLPTARRRHILPTAQWGHLATDGLVVPWDVVAAARLTDLVWLRTTVGATWPQLSRSAPPSRLLRTQSAEHWPRVVAAWTALQTWRIAPPLWAVARSLTNPPATGAEHPELAATLSPMTAAPTPTQAWQAMVPELPPFESPADTAGGSSVTSPANTAERLLLLLHYSIDWDTSWVADPRYRKTYWDEQLPGRVRRAAYRADTLDRWWSDVSGQLGAPAPRQRDRRLELATLLREPPLPVIAVLRESLPALLLRVRIIAEAVAEQRKAARG